MESSREVSERMIGGSFPKSRGDIARKPFLIVGESQLGVGTRTGFINVVTVGDSEGKIGFVMRKVWMSKRDILLPLN